MSRLIRPADGPPHRCKPPGTIPHITDMHASARHIGAIWQCDCGRYWRCRNRRYGWSPGPDGWWDQISERQARRAAWIGRVEAS